MEHSRTRFPLFTFLLGVITLTCLAVPASHADTQYVTDMLVLSLREGPGNEHNTIRTLQTNAPVEVLEEQEGFLKVRTEQGEEGWVLKQYITSETPKPIIIAGLNKEIERLKARLEQFKKSRESLKEKWESDKGDQVERAKALEADLAKYKEAASKNAKKLKEVSEKYDRFLSQSKDVVALVAERDSLLTTNNELKAASNSLRANIEQLQQENSRLFRNKILKWFLAGSGVFFVGLIIGKVSRKRKRY